MVIFMSIKFLMYQGLFFFVYSVFFDVKRYIYYKKNILFRINCLFVFVLVCFYFLNEFINFNIINNIFIF